MKTLATAGLFGALGGELGYVSHSAFLLAVGVALWALVVWWIRTLWREARAWNAAGGPLRQRLLYCHRDHLVFLPGETHGVTPRETDGLFRAAMRQWRDAQ